MLIRDFFGLAYLTRLDMRECLFGLECEIEALDDPEQMYECGFVRVEDLSLRNNGFEFLSSPPTTLHQTLKSFEKLHNDLDFVDGGVCKFSERTSTHVHVNCRMLDEKHINHMIMLYALFEPIFFMFVDSSRKSNIHCVPLTETVFCQLYNKPLDFLVHKTWHKYTAFNIKPLSSLGTVEFRHLQGTDDVDVLETWLTIINNLWLLCQTEPLSLKTVTDEDTIYAWYKNLFTKNATLPKAALLSMISNQHIDVKLSLI